ncbi:MAG: methionyl-tRNA formyltransferase [Pseudomonadota bacterium]|nr:methionyl-tRNA formyltransferase [Pseudomonadota bacterium]
MSELRLCFAGTPDFSAAHLSALIASGHTIDAVYTQPDRPSGRGKKLQPSPVKAVAMTAGLEIRQPASLKTVETQQELAAIAPDLLVVVAYGLILPQAVLELPKLGCINVHASLLPRWRGAAPIERALLAGDAVSGVTIMKMDAGLDTGDMLYKQQVAIDPEDDRISLTDKICEAGKLALLHTLSHFPELSSQAQRQNDSLSTYADKLEKSESLLRWQEPAEKLHRIIRAGLGRAPAFSFINGARLQLLEASVAQTESQKTPGTILEISRQGILIACGEACLLVTRIALPGKKPWTITDLLNSGTDLLQAGAILSHSD